MARLCSCFCGLVRGWVRGERLSGLAKEGESESGNRRLLANVVDW